MDLWLFFEAKMGSANKKFGKHCQLYFLTAWVFLAQCWHLTAYSMVGHLPAHFRDLHIVS